MATVYSLICFGGKDGKTATMTIASPCVVTLTNHGLRAGTGVVFTTTGALPTGVTSGTTYYANSTGANTFNLYDTSANAIAGGSTGRVNTSGSQSGTHTIKSAYYNALSDKSRWTVGGTEYIYDSLKAWRDARNTAGVSVYDHEICEIGMGWVDVTTTAVAIDWAAAATTITTTVNGSRVSDAFHNGVIGAASLSSTGYCIYGSGAACINASAGNVTVDGLFFVVANSGVGGFLTTRFGSVVKNCVLRGNKPAGASSQYGIRTTTPSCVCTIHDNVMLEVGGGGLFTMADQGAGNLIYNNLAHNCNVGFYSEGANNRGFYYNNISVGNDTNWGGTPSAIEGAGYNGGESGNTPWNTGAATAITTFDSTDFLDYTNHDFRPASSTAPQVDTGTAVPNGASADLKAGYRPSYVDGTDAWDLGPFEYDWGNGLPPITVTITNLLAGSEVNIFETGTTNHIAGTTSSGTTYSPSGVGAEAVDITIQKAGTIPRRIVNTTLSDGLSIDGSQTTARWYVASSGLTINTNAFANATTKKFGLTVASTLQNFASYMMEQWIALAGSGEAYANVEFPIEANGPNSFTFINGWEFDLTGYSASITNLSRDGLRYLNTSDVVTASWAAILTSGVPSGTRVRYQQSDGGTTVSAAVTSGNMDQLVQIYGDASHGNFDYTNYLVLKVQAEGYDQAEANVVTLYGTLEDQLYVVGLTPTANGIATGNPTVSLTLTRGTYVDVTSGKTFGIKIISADSGTDILRELRYNFGAGGEYPASSGYDGFDWHDLIQTNGTEFKTVRGNLYGTAATKGVVVYLSGTTLHPDFNLFTADDGTTYTPAPASTVTLTGLISGSRVQLYDTTNSVELYNDVVASTTLIYSETYSVDRAIRLRVSYVSGTSAKEFIEASIGSITTGTPDVSYIVSQTNDTTYNSNGINGPSIYATSGITFTDAATDLVNCNIAGGSVTYPTIYACFVYWNFTSTGIANDFTYVEAPDTANYLFSGMKIRNTSATDLMVTGGYGRDATSGLSSDIIDTAGSTGNIFLAPDHVVPYATGSGVTSQDKIDIAAQVLTAAAAAPIYADMRKTNGTTLQGDGTEANKFRSSLVA